MQGENRSEVARLMQEIEKRYTSAKLGLEGTAIKAPHEFITKQMENLGVIHEKIVANSIWTYTEQGKTPT